MWFWLFGGILLAAWLVFAVQALPGLFRSVALTHVSPPASAASSDKRNSRERRPHLPHYPKVSIILAGKNEAGSLPRTLSSLKDQTWPNLEVIVVNDRSTDNTEDILQSAVKTWPELKVIQITELPVGWLGKTYALQTAADTAAGEWLLFTDADVSFAKDAVEAAVGYALARKTDHLALSPHITEHGFWLRSAVYFFLYNVVLAFRPQNADQTNSSASVGIGAFNLVQKDVYESVGGHASVALRTDEDLALGSVIKGAGYNQVFAGGTNLLSVEWYPTLPAMARGLEKNALAPFQYKFTRFYPAMLAMLVFYTGPAAGSVLASDWTRSLFAAAWILETYLFHMTRKYSGVSLWWALTLPLAAPVLVFILVRAAILAAVRGGIQWRGTFYSLRQLRRPK